MLHRAHHFLGEAAGVVHVVAGVAVGLGGDEAQVGAVKVAVAAGKNVRYHSADAAQVGTVASISI